MSSIALTISRRAALFGGIAALAAGACSRPAAAFTVKGGAVLGRDGWLFYAPDDPREYRASRVRSMVMTIGATVRQLEQAGIKTVIAFVPSKARLYRNELPEDLDFTPESIGRYKATVEMLRETGALVPDLEDALLALRAKSPNAPLYFHADTHWTALAAETAASSIGDQMIKSLNLPRSSAPGMKPVKTEIDTFTTNDLARMLPWAERSAYPGERFARTGFATHDNSLLDNDAADVAVVGCSFMQPALNFAPMLSARLNRPVSLTWNVHDVGPYATMQAYLQSKDFKRNRPKAIVWNFHENDLILLINNIGAFGQHAMSPKDFLDSIQAALTGAPQTKPSVTASLK
jgi:alginate O-acetyltransferase complex protein AlgJ